MRNRETPVPNPTNARAFVGSIEPAVPLRALWVSRRQDPVHWYGRASQPAWESIWSGGPETALRLFVNGPGQCSPNGPEYGQRTRALRRAYGHAEDRQGDLSDQRAAP